MIYFVYEHWRPDTNTCFYVGKGKMRRARSFEARNDRHGKIVAKLRRAGLEPEIKIVAHDLSNSQAMALEIRQIAMRRAAGIDLANYTDGGDGTSGYKLSSAAKAKISARARGRKMSDESRAKLSVIRSNWKWSDVTKAKMSLSASKVQSASRKIVCATPAGKANMVAMSQKAAADPAVRLQRSINAKALWADPAYRSKVMAARAKQ